jgi:hypothetical protein
VNRLRAVLRRLDAWAALVLGILVALGVIILLATPGPWHVVVSSAPQVRLIPPPPSDVVVFVNGTSTPGRCTGVVWLHLAYDVPALTCVVVPAELDVEVPGAGYAPVAAVVRDAGPAAASNALGGTLGVKMDAWALLGRDALKAAFPASVAAAGTTLSGRARVRAAWRAWDRSEAPAKRFAAQTAFLNRAVSDSSWVDLNLVAFVNYVLGAPSVATDLGLQGASAIATALKTAAPYNIAVGALPAEELRCGAYRRWVPQRRALLALQQSFAFDASVPVFPAVVARHRLSPRVLVVTSPARAGLLGAYRSGLEKALARSAGRPIAVEIVPVASAIAALPVVERAVSDPSLAVVVAVGRQRPAVPEGIEQGLRVLLDALAKAGQPALVSEIPVTVGGRWPQVNRAIDTAASASGTPLSPVAPLLGPAGRTVDAALYSRWARLNAAALVRAVEPAFFGPDLLSTRSGFDYYQRTRTTVTVAGPAPAGVTREAASVANLGFRAVRSASEDLPAAGYRALYYRPAQARAAFILADELGLPDVAVTASPPPPSGDLALVLP